MRQKLRPIGVIAVTSIIGSGIVWPGVARASVGGGIQIDFTDGTTLLVVPGWWSWQNVWYLNINVRSARATFGVMGSIAPRGWLPALPDGSTFGARPASLAQRYDQIYGKFADAWRVTKNTSLFDYGSGLGTDDFTLEGWPAFQPTSCKLPKEWTTNPELPKKPLLIPLGDREEQMLVSFERRDGAIVRRDIAPVRFVPLLGTHGWQG